MIGNASIAETVLHALALAATVVGIVGFYLSAPRQQWLSHPLAGRRSRMIGALALLEGWLLWSVAMHPVTALFTSLTVAMLLLTILPFAAAARGAVLARREG
ncbi:hypothetical protein FBZ83_103112 [Azospirillum brasilense]|uniref:Uncharacterized protein n=1 Tax=Azospirillum brasilense TaxID=192 RepID=A0A560CL15_AZOBR|nr:hypothetical protein [Azospirillum brasilense]TWA85521.1 hypothetical protein FBZ83_103112 [Azospirillum brasilense]